MTKRLILAIAVLAALAAGCSDDPNETYTDSGGKSDKDSSQTVTQEVLAGNNAAIADIVITSGVVSSFDTPLPVATIKVCDAEVGTVYTPTVPVPSQIRVGCAANSDGTIKLPPEPPAIGTAMTVSLIPDDHGSYAIRQVTMSGPARALVTPVPLEGYAEPIPVDLNTYQQAVG